MGAAKRKFPWKQQSLSMLGSRSRIFILVTAVTFACTSAALALDRKASLQGIVECTNEHLQNHNPDIVGTPDRVVCFQAYISNFNTSAVDLGNGKSRAYAIPHWSIQKVERAEKPPKTKGRPTSWFTIPELQEQGIAPTNASYAFSQKFLNKHKNWYQRRHLSQKYLAERLGGRAG